MDGAAGRHQEQLLRAAQRAGLGPRRPMPFPDSGKLIKLLLCPRCGMKGMLWFHSPTEHGYPTACIKCRARHVIKRNDTTFHEIQTRGGFTPRHPLARETSTGELDMTKAWDYWRELRDLGFKKVNRRGGVPKADKPE